MKKFLITGCVRCGHKIFNLEKHITAATAVEAVKTFKANFPNAKMIRSKILEKTS